MPGLKKVSMGSPGAALTTKNMMVEIPKMSGTELSTRRSRYFVTSGQDLEEKNRLNDSPDPNTTRER